MPIAITEDHHEVIELRKIIWLERPRGQVRASAS